MGNVAQLLTTITPPPAKHTGSCCGVYTFLSQDGIDAEDVDAVWGIILSADSAEAASNVLRQAGLNLGPQGVQRHRNDSCRCCAFHGATHG